jgi:hypothetical protein
LSLGIKRRLRSLSEASDQRGGPAVAPILPLKAGTKLVREWHGQVHTVDVLDDGFAYQGERYRSLTRIARRITGVQWSGPVFFRLKRHPPERGALAMTRRGGPPGQGRRRWPGRFAFLEILEHQLELRDPAVEFL